MAKKTDWTERSVKDFIFSIGSDFMNRVQEKMESDGITQAQLARKLGVTPGRVSQFINNPGNLTLQHVVRCARCLGLKVSLLAYDDRDPDNEDGPISGDIFLDCWEKSGSPRDMWAASAKNGANGKASRPSRGKPASPVLADLEHVVIRKGAKAAIPGAATSKRKPSLKPAARRRSA